MVADKHDGESIGLTSSSAQKQANKIPRKKIKLDIIQWFRKYTYTWLPYIAAILSVILKSTGLIFCSLIGTRIPEMEKNFFRFLFQLILVTPLLWCTEHHRNIKVSWKDVPWVVVTCVCTFIRNLGMFLSSIYIPVGTLIAIYHAVLLIILVILSKLLIKKAIGIPKLLAVFIAIVGIILVVQPRFMFNNPELHSIPYNLSCDNEVLHLNNLHPYINLDDLSVNTTHRQTIGYIIISIVGIIGAIYTLTINQHLQHMSTILLSFWIAVSGTSLSVVMLFTIEDPVWPTSLICLLFFVVHVSTAMGGSVIYNYSVRFIDPVFVSLLQALQVIPLFIMQYTLLKGIAPSYHNWVEILGAVVICLCIAITPIHTFIRHHWGDNDTIVPPCTSSGNSGCTDDKINTQDHPKSHTYGTFQ